MDLIRVYRIPFSTNVERVAIAAGHKGVPIEWIDVDPDDRSAVEAVSGQRLVPVLVADGEIVADSPRILEWLEERHPELWSRVTARRAFMRDRLGIQVRDEVLPLSPTAGYFPPFWLELDRVLTFA